MTNKIVPFFSLLLCTLSLISPHSKALKIESSSNSTPEIVLNNSNLNMEKIETLEKFVEYFINPEIYSKKFKINDYDGFKNYSALFSDVLHILYKFSKDQIFLINRKSFYYTLNDTIKFDFINGGKIILDGNQVWWDFVMYLSKNYLIPIINTDNKLQNDAEIYLKKIYLYSIKLKKSFKNEYTYKKLDDFINDIKEFFPDLKYNKSYFV